MMPFCLLQDNKNDIQAYSKQTVVCTALWHSLKNQFFVYVWNIILFNLFWICTNWSTKVIYTGLQKWPKLLLIQVVYEAHISLQDSLCCSELVHYKFYAKYACSACEHVWCPLPINHWIIYCIHRHPLYRGHYAPFTINDWIHHKHLHHCFIPGQPVKIFPIICFNFVHPSKCSYPIIILSYNMLYWFSFHCRLCCYLD